MALRMNGLARRRNAKLPGGSELLLSVETIWRKTPRPAPLNNAELSEIIVEINDLQKRFSTLAFHLFPFFFQP
jgi:hypothetical protein